MRRLIGIFLSCVIALSLFACAPDNVLPSNQPDTTDLQAQTKPDITQTTTDQTITTQTQPEAAAATNEQLTSGALYLQNKKKNDHIRPTFDIDGAGITNFKTPQLNGVKLSFFISNSSAFSAGSMTEQQWFDALDKEFRLKIDYKIRPDSTLYSSQLIAQKSGMTVDIVTTDVTNSAANMSLMASASDVTSLDESSPVSKRVFDLSGGKLFSAKGNCRVLWYNAAKSGDSKPFDMYNKNEWTTEKLTLILNSLDTARDRLIENNNWLAFGSAGTLQASGLTDTGYNTLSLTDESVLETNEAFGAIFNKDNAMSGGDYSFKAGNTVFTFTNMPARGDFELGWAPVPKFTDAGSYVGELCGNAMGLSKTVSDSNRGAAVAFMTLWCARYSESRTDTLIYDLKLTPTQADSYLTFCESSGGLYSVDKTVTDQFEAEKMPVELYGTPETVYNTFGVAYNRTDVLNDRYR